MGIVKECYDKTSHKVNIFQMVKSLKGLGYVIKNNTIKNIEPIPLDQNNQKVV